MPISIRRAVRLGSLFCAVLVITACGGGGGGDPAPAPAPVPFPGGPITISGTAQFDSVPASTTSAALNYAGTTSKPIRGATVQLLNAAGQVLSTATTDDQGRYSVSLDAQQQVTVRVRAELRRTGSTGGSWDFTVRDNTASNALYVLDSAGFTPTASTTRDLHAASGWGGTGYTSTRSAGPFALLDVIYMAQRKIATVSPDLALPALRVLWSPNNRPVDGDIAVGDIGTSFYSRNTLGEHELYILGAANVDTDEYDSHVIAHEFGHYMQAVVSRDDSIGGPHAGGDKLDPRVAFSEGFANGWSGAVLTNPRYSDATGSQQASGFTMDLNTAPSQATAGWYAEDTVQYLVWSAHEDATAGFAPMFSALQTLRTSPAFTTFHGFHAAMKAAAPSATATLDARAQQQRIFGTDAFATGETNDSGSAAQLPVYKTHTAALGAWQTYCVTGTDTGRNKLGHHVFIRFTLASAGSRTLTAQRNAGTTAATDPDFVVLASDLNQYEALSFAANSETMVRTLPAGTHVVALSDYNLTTSSTRCLDFKVE